MDWDYIKDTGQAQMLGETLAANMAPVEVSRK
jgi:hypothetical protein